MRTFVSLRVGALCLIAFLIAGAALAVPINYGDFDDFANGGTVCYIQVTEDSLTDALPLYGSPTVLVNTLDFDPIGFGASSTGGGVDLTDGQLNFGILAKSGSFIDVIELSERGDFSLAGVGTAGTYVSVSVPVTLEIEQVDGSSITPITISTNMTFTPSGGAYDLPSYPGIGQAWSASIDLDIEQILIDEGVSFTIGATYVDLAIDNTMVAVSEAGSTAFIAKKDFKGLSITVVPEPATMGLVLLGGLSLALARRRR